MDAATLQNRIYKGYAKAAARIGVSYTIARPLTAAAPLGNTVGSLLCSFNSEDWTYIKPNKYGKPTWYGLFDGTLTRAGDYLLGPQGPFFVAGQQLHLSILCVSCNRSVAIMRPLAPANAVGVQPYGGIYPPNEAAALGVIDATGVLVTGWPASILTMGRSEASTGLPMSVKNAGYVLLLPPSVPIVLREGDLVLDDLGRRYLLESSELTDLGWRCNAKEAHA